MVYNIQILLQLAAGTKQGLPQEAVTRQFVQNVTNPDIEFMTNREATNKFIDGCLWKQTLLHDKINRESGDNGCSDRALVI